MTCKAKAFSLYCIAMLLAATFLNILPVLAAPAASFKIEQVVWGPSVNNPVAVQPGDTNVPLTMNVRNRSNYRLNGIYATLYLNSSFNGVYLITNTTGGFEASTVGQALQLGDVLYPTGEVLPGTAFSLTFSLNIDQNARRGSYAYTLRVDYLVNQSGIIFEGESQFLDAIITLPNRAPIIDSFTPSSNPTIYLGEFLNFSIIAHDPDGDNLTYRWIIDDATVSNLSWFLYKPSKRDIRSHTVEVRVTDGTLIASQTWSLSVPNRAPIIDSFTPRDINPTVYVGDMLNFSAICRDLDGDSLIYRWILDDITVTNSSWFVYKPSKEDVRSHIVRLEVSDGNLNATQTWTVSVDWIRTTMISASSNYLIGGLSNTLNITLRNNFWKGSVEVQITLPAQTPLIIYGNSSWIFRNVEPNGSISIQPKIYVPSTLIGTTFTMVVTASYMDELGRSFTDTYNVGFIISGLIDLMVYDVNVTPQPAQPGSTVTITATLLNKGNIPATNMNISIQPTPVLHLSSLSKYLIDQIDKNSPEPISLRANVNSNVENGTYPVTLTISYLDDQLIEHAINVTAYITVAEKTGDNIDQTSETPIVGFLRTGGLAIIILVVVTVILFVFYLRHRTKR